MPMYIIPIFRRATKIDISSNKPRKELYMCVDGIGIYVTTPVDIEPTEEMVRRHLKWFQKLYKLVTANGPLEAVEKLFFELKKINVGGSGKNDQALFLNDKEAIMEIPTCSMLEEFENRYCCKINVRRDDDSKIGLCIIDEEGNFPDNPSCPIWLMRRVLDQKEFNSLMTGISLDVPYIDGLKVVSIRDLIPEKTSFEI